MVVAYVIVHGCAGINASPIEYLGIPWAALKNMGGRGGFMAAGCPDSVLWGSL